tara:strand:- start:137 stop:499 length:363 start_codon:yes stop_codon:yes gene_type:complete
MEKNTTVFVVEGDLDEVAHNKLSKAIEQLCNQLGLDSCLNHYEDAEYDEYSQTHTAHRDDEEAEDLSSDDRLKLYDNWVDSLQMLKDINELLPYNQERQVALDNLGKQEDIVYKWWRTGQ